ncbi:MAG: SDR family oxidoreductase [Deltaproteobacteria bacterium]|nr:SDR family oxidoreductase [Deltaproteobacteria bacterium]
MPKSAADSLQGLRVAITGGTSGLGLALVEQLRERGAAVAFVARDTHKVQAIAGKLDGTHGFTGDVSRKEEIHPIALGINAALGGLDVLINNASSLGPVPLALLADTECEDLETALDTNLLGPFRLTKALLGSLTASAREGRSAVVINITSDAAATPYPTWGAYGVSKAALSHLSRIWQEELQEHGVRVEAIDPGDMDTPLHHLAVLDADPAELKRPQDSAREIITWIENARKSQEVTS